MDNKAKKVKNIRNPPPKRGLIKAKIAEELREGFITLTRGQARKGDGAEGGNTSGKPPATGV